MPKGIYKRTEETKKALSLARIKSGQKPPSRLGIPNTPEQKEKIRLKMKNRKITWRDKISKGNTGKKRSIESCLNLSKGQLNSLKNKGKNHYNWQGGITPFYRIMRVARLKAVGGLHTNIEWETLKAQYNWTCPCCKKNNIKLTKDHIIPVKKGGSDNIENIQPLCASCNSKKHIKIVKYDYQLVSKDREIIN